MGERDYVSRLSDEDDKRVHIHTVRGRVIEFTVQQEAVISGRRYRVVRYDTSHGRAHRDTLDLSGNTIAKRWLDDPTLEDALQYAMDDIDQHWSRYREDFIRRMR